jgi:hypothetical protein
MSEDGRQRKEDGGRKAEDGGVKELTLVVGFGIMRERYELYEKHGLCYPGFSGAFFFRFKGL